MTFSIVILSALALELVALYPATPGASAPSFPGWGWLRAARLILPCLLILGAFLCWALARGERDTRLKALFSRSGNARPILFLAWVVALSLSEELVGRSPLLLVIGLVAVALVSWRKPLLLAGGAVAGSASLVVVDILLKGGLDFERVLVAAAAAGLGVAVGDTMRSANLRSADRLDSLKKENEKLWELSFRDALTGLYNRRYAVEIGTMLIARAKRYNEQLHVLMLDIDRFKSVNDKLGHPVGDEVLNGIAEILMKEVRASDVVTRYGGEEFLLFLIQTEPEVVQFIANRIRDSVASHGFAGVPWTITISIGVAGIRADDAFDDLVDRADKYLYASKRAGRNRVTGF
jgi:diguanylate cyclase (GGDEF)-like protein